MSKAKIVTDLKNNYFTNNKITFGTSQPTSGSYAAGDVVISKSPNANAYGWICTSSGSPGSWKVLKSASDLPSMSWDNISGKPSTFPAVIGTTTTTATRGDIGETAYRHSQSAHAPSNAQKNSDITKAEIEAKLTGAISSHSHNYAAVNHGNHVPGKESADNRKFLGSDGKWRIVFPNFISGIAHINLPNHLSGAPESYVKLCNVQLVPTDNSHCEILLSGNGDYGQTGHSFGILRVSGRGAGAVKYLQLMRSDTTQIEIGYVKSGSSMDVWVKRPAFDGLGAMTVLGISPNHCTIFKNPEITANKPSGYQAVVSDDPFNICQRGMCLENNVSYKGGTNNYSQYHLMGVDANNNIYLGWDNQTYINVNNSIKGYKDIHIQNGAGLYAQGIRFDNGNGGTIDFGSQHVRLEYNKSEQCVYVAGSETDFYGYHMSFRAKTFQAVDYWMKFGSHWLTIGGSAPPNSSAGDVWFRV